MKPKKEPRQPKHKHHYTVERVQRGDKRGELKILYKCDCGDMYWKTEYK